MNLNKENILAAAMSADHDISFKYCGLRKSEAYKVSKITRTYLEELPIGWNCNCTKEEYYAQCAKEVKARYKEQVVGFLGIGTFIGYIMGGIIGWVVRKYLDYLWDKEEST